MENPGTWPLKVVLPLIRGTKQAKTYQEGFLYYLEERPMVFLGNMFAIADGTAKLEGLETIWYDSFEAISVAGWRID